VHWKYKAAIQNLLGGLPRSLGNPIYYQLQCTFGGLRRTTPLSRLSAGIELVRRVHRYKCSVESATFLEIGTGHQLALPLSLWLCGAAEITTVDLNRYLKEKLVLNDIEYLRRHADEVRNMFREISPSRLFETRFERLLAGASNLRELLSLTNIRYQAPADASCLALEANSIDYHVSFTVLEHIPVPAMKRIFREGRRLLKPDGLFIHYIDFSDHFAHSDEAISSVNFLRFSESEWESLAGNRYMFHNRLRLDEFRNLLLDLNLAILALESRVDDAAVDLLRKGFPLNERFQTKESSTNAATDAWVVAAPDWVADTRCPSAVPGRQNFDEGDPFDAIRARQRRVTANRVQ
jgi:SAM-dependent methyltransferase